VTDRRVRYARNGAAHLAYRIFGDAGPTLVWATRTGETVSTPTTSWLLSRFGGVRAKHTGDGIFAVFDGPTRAVRCGLELVPTLATRGLSIRAGLHTAECERRGGEWSGMAVHIGARTAALAGAGEILTSRTVRDLSAGSGLIFES
jgi:hypothetical protein